MNRPESLRDYACDDYFAGGWSEHGYWDEPSQIFLIVPWRDAYEDEPNRFFVIGRPGVDGIAFGYRKGLPGIWAFYPIESEFKYMAASIQDLAVGNWIV